MNTPVATEFEATDNWPLTTDNGQRTIFMKLTINEVAQCLDLPPTTIERWARQGRIPIHKSGNSYIAKRVVLERWAATHNLPFLMPSKSIGENQDSGSENLLAAMKRGGVFHDITGNDVETVIRSAVSNIPDLSEDAREELYERLIEREKLTSTGVGRGVAIPHPRSPLSEPRYDPLIATCFLKEPTDFDAVDDEPVFVMFILVSPSTKLHLHLLSKLSFCVRNNIFLKFLKTSPNSVELFSRIEGFENQFDWADHF
ncbi:PTS sugar transporter subunit IIA [Desulfococcaceae bacterium HSG8]|nr:PTS sugar transporter subunit IIA [Desulfococcaceae bacterium HSG8]